MSLTLPKPMSLLSLRFASVVLLFGTLCGAFSPAQADPPDWSVNSNEWPDFMVVIGRLDIDGVATVTPNTLVGAFVGDEVRGVAEIDLRSVGTLGPRFFLNVYSNVSSGETVTFKAYDPTSDAVLPIEETLMLDVNEPAGSLPDPFVWNAAAVVGPPDWSLNPSDFEFVMPVTGTVQIDGALISETPGSLVGAFVGEEVRGVAEVDLRNVDLFGPLFFLQIRSNVASGETVTFKVWDAESREVLQIAETITFVEGLPGLGSPSNPFVWNASGALSVDLTGQEGWRLLTAPTDEATVDDLLGPIWTQGFPGADQETGFPNVYRWDEALGWQVPSSQSETVGSGNGLAVFVYEDDDLDDGTPGTFPHTLQVSGSAPTTSIDFSPSFTPGPRAYVGWHLVGNPYTSALDWDADGWVRTNMSEVVYVWDPNLSGGTYLTWNGNVGDLGDGLIAPFQGFWVQALADAPALVAPVSAIVEGEDGTFYGRGAITEVPALRFEVTGEVGGTARTASSYIALDDEASAGFDALDAHELASLASTSLALFSQAGAAGDLLDLDINTLPLPEQELLNVPLGVEATVLDPEAVSLTLTWSLRAVPEEWTLTLTDSELGVTVDLRTETDYAFELNAEPRPAGDSEGPSFGPGTHSRGSEEVRFSVQIARGVPTSGEPAVADEFGVETVFPNPSTDEATVRYRLGTPGPVRLAVYDLLGREVAVLVDGLQAAGQRDARFDGHALSSGTYLLRLEAGGTVHVRPITLVR